VKKVKLSVKVDLTRMLPIVFKGQFVLSYMAYVFATRNLEYLNFSGAEKEEKMDYLNNL
jgi:hypothetical protein